MVEGRQKERKGREEERAKFDHQDDVNDDGARMPSDVVCGHKINFSDVCSGQKGRLRRL